MIPVGKLICVTLSGHVPLVMKSGFKGGNVYHTECKRRRITPKPENVNLIIINDAVPMRTTFLAWRVNWRVNCVQLLGMGLA